MREPQRSHASITRVSLSHSMRRKPATIPGERRGQSASRSSLLLEKRIDGRVSDRLIPDCLVDVVRGSVGEIGVQKTELAAVIEQLLAERGDARAGKSFAAIFRRRIDPGYANAVWCRSRISRHRDRRSFD